MKWVIKIRRILNIFIFLNLFNFSYTFSQFIDQYVVLVIIDGARYSETLGDTLKRYTPRMHQLAMQGAVIDTFLNDSLTYTKRAIPAIWCGSWAAPRDTIINGNQTQYTIVPTFWEYYRKDQNKDSTDAIHITKYFTAPWLPSYHPNYGPRYWPYFAMKESIWSDLYVWNLTKTTLKTYHPKFSVVYLADVDAAGHSGNWNNYTRAIRIADSIVGMLWDFLQTDTIFQNRTTMIVTNDHGRHLDTVSSGFVGHGDGCWGCRRIQFLAVGSNIKKGKYNIKRKIPDITPTIGSILNFNSPYSTGSRISEILKPIISIDKKQINFGNVYINSTIKDSIKIFNSGSSNLAISFNLPPVINIHPGNIQIPPHKSQTFLLTFSPIDTGNVNERIIVNHNDEHQTDTIYLNAKVNINKINLTINFKKGWNLVSIPLKTEKKHIDSIFTNHTSKAFIYRNAYIATDTLEFKTGCWLKFSDSSSAELYGTFSKIDTLDVNAGWNLIGTISFPVLVSEIITIPENIVSSKIYTYNKNYYPVDTLYPGNAYWIKTKTNGKIILKSYELHR